MSRLKTALLFGAVTSLSGLLIGLNGCGSSGRTMVQSAAKGKINHVVVIFQENRTPDNLFHDTVLINRGADIASSGQISTGQTIPLTPVPLDTLYDLGHGHPSFLLAWNNGAMNGADQVPVNCGGNPNCIPPPDPAYQYVQASDVQPYFTMAETYTFGDRMFQTNQGPSFPAHQYIISGTSAVSETSTISVADNPSNDMRPDGLFWAGCLAPPGAVVNTIDTSQPNPNTKEVQTDQLCYEHPTLTDVLDSNHLSWKYYAPFAGKIWTAPNAIEHMCQPTGSGDNIVCSGPDWTNNDPNVVIEGTNNQIVTDIANGKLAAVSWVIPDGAASDHAGSNQGLGPSWVASIVNAIGQSQYWANTAIIITWDDWGGWYDHVAPTVRNSYEYGLRVPLVVISPFAKAAYISHVNHDFGSILKFIEGVFSLPEVDPPVGYADARSDDLSDCFNFSQTPLTFTPIAAPHNAEFFQNRKAEPTPPDDD